MKKQFTNEEILQAKQLMQKIAVSSNREELMAQTINDVYDVEYPIQDLVANIFNTGSADAGEHVYYLVPKTMDKKVIILTSDCQVTHQKVSPETRQELSFVPVVTPDYYACLQDLLNGDHDVLSLYGEDAIEAMNRYEIYSVLQLIDAGAVARGNVFTPTSGNEKLDLPKLVAMKKAVRKFGKKLVLVTGANVTEDCELMDYDADKKRQISVKDVVDEWIPIESLDVTVGGSATDVIDDDVAYLVAVSDSKKNKPGYFYRRKISSSMIASSPDTTVINKERAIIVTGTMKSTDTVDRFSKGIAGVEQIGAVLTNSYCVAKFVRS
jgi:hypothetical protein